MKTELLTILTLKLVIFRKSLRKVSYLIKTDTNGNIDCNQFNYDFIVTSPATIIGNTATLTSSGCIINSTATSIGSGCIVNIPCHVGINETGNIHNYSFSQSLLHLYYSYY